MSSDGDGIGAMFVGVGAGVYFFFKGFHELRLRRLIKNTPTSKVRSMAMGLVELKGKAKYNEEPLISPISGKDCVFYTYIVEEYRSSGKSGRWVKIAGNKSANKFYLEDDTGRVAIDPTKITPDYKYDLQSQTAGIGSKLSPEVSKFLNSKGYKTTGIFRRSYRCKEAYVEEGDDIYVLGKTIKGENNEVIVTGNDFKYSYISDKKEEELDKGFFWKVMLKVWGGAALSIACLAGLLLYFGVI